MKHFYIFFFPFLGINMFRQFDSLTVKSYLINSQFLTAGQLEVFNKKNEYKEYEYKVIVGVVRIYFSFKSCIIKVPRIRTFIFKRKTVHKLISMKKNRSKFFQNILRLRQKTRLECLEKSFGTSNGKKYIHYIVLVIQISPETIL